jgi:hypothetical protein
MHDPSNAFLAALNAAMAAHPQQRAAQVIVNALGTDPFYLDDYEATQKLWKYVHLAQGKQK